MARSNKHQKSDQSGFTLIELVIVILLMSIVSLAGVEVIRQSSEAYLKMSNRQVIGNAARLSVERLSRELRAALPGSVRTNTNCLEYIPIRVAGRYFTLPVETSGTTMQIVPVAAELQSETGSIAVYPVGASPYDTSTNVLSPTATIGAPGSGNVSEISWTGSHGFPFRSPTSRFYMVSDPVSYCVDGDNLLRYSNYGLNSAQPTIGDLPTSLPDRALLVTGVKGSVSPFQVADPGLSRNAMVEFNLSFSSDGEFIQISHEAQLRNVP
jgi:MSHA biogenesis protein MshO